MKRESRWLLSDVTEVLTEELLNGVIMLRILLRAMRGESDG